MTFAPDPCWSGNRITHLAMASIKYPGRFVDNVQLQSCLCVGISGQGQTIVVVEDTNLYDAADWDTFRSVMGLASAYPLGSLTQVHPPSSPINNNCLDPGLYLFDEVEAAVDVNRRALQLPAQPSNWRPARTPQPISAASLLFRTC